MWVGAWTVLCDGIQGMADGTEVLRDPIPVGGVIK